MADRPMLEFLKKCLEELPEQTRHEEYLRVVNYALGLEQKLNAPVVLYGLPGFARELNTSIESIAVIHRRNKLPEPIRGLK
jgi:hypothetical protein